MVNNVDTAFSLLGKCKAIAACSVQCASVGSFRRFCLLLLTTWLSACSIISRETTDGPPRVTVDVSHVANAQPQPVVRTRAGNAKQYRVFGKTYKVLADSQGYRAHGIASWYGTKFHGQRTANGEIYNMYAMTAAHKTLPIPSYVRITHLGNGRSIIVRINDRGPFVDDRLIDLSYVAAKKLDITQHGTARVEIEDVTPSSRQLVAGAGSGSPVTARSPVPVEGMAASATDQENDGEEKPNDISLYLQLGAFEERSTAVGLQFEVMDLLAVPVNIFIGDDRLHRVKLGPGGDESELTSWQKILRANGISSGFIVRR
ncbi:MAG: rare lipoprotein A [Cellvibrionaceae bacterium]